MGNAEQDEENAKSRVRRFLAQGAATLEGAAAMNKVLLDAGERGTISVERKLLAGMVRAGDLKMSGGKIMLAEVGGRPPAENHRDIGSITIDSGGTVETVAVNWSENRRSDN